MTISAVVHGPVLFLPGHGRGTILRCLSAGNRALMQDEPQRCPNRLRERRFLFLERRDQDVAKLAGDPSGLPRVRRSAESVQFCVDRSHDVSKLFHSYSSGSLSRRAAQQESGYGANVGESARRRVQSGRAVVGRFARVRRK